MHMPQQNAAHPAANPFWTSKRENKKLTGEKKTAGVQGGVCWKGAQESVNTFNGQTGLGQLCKAVKKKQFDTMFKETDRKVKSKET